MDLMILKFEPNQNPPMYRGMDRATPTYYAGGNEEHPANQLFFWYLQQGGQSGVIHDIEHAAKLLEAYSKLDPPQYFEVIEITTHNKPPTLGGELLGFDLASGSYSLLGWGLEIDRKLPLTMPQTDLYRVIFPLLTLVKEYFQPRLNQNGLFREYATATFCLECMIALQTIRPGLWEDSHTEFQVVGIWKII